MRASLALAAALAGPVLAQPAPFAFGGPQEDVAYAVDVAADGTFAVGGFTWGGYDPDPGPADATVLSGGRTDGFAAVYGPGGALRFAVPFGPPGPSAFDGVYDVALGPSGELAVVGQVGETLDLDPGPGEAIVEAPGLGVNVFLAVYEPGGAFRFGFALPGVDFEQRAHVDVGGDGAVYLAASVSGPTDLDPGAGEAIVDGFRSATLASYTAAGAFRWGFALEGAQYRARGVDVNGGRVVLTGDLVGGAVDVDPGPAVREVEGVSSTDWLTATYTTDGALDNAFAVGGSTFGGVVDVALDGDGGVALVGTVDRDADFDPGPGSAVVSGAGNGSDGLGVVAAYGPDAAFRYAFGVGTARPGAVALRGGRLVWTGHIDDPLDADPGDGTALVTPVAGFDVVTVSLDGGGAFEWASAITGPGTGDNGLAVALGPQGRTAVSGRFSGTVDVEPGDGVVELSSDDRFDYDVYVVTYGRDGALAARPTADGGGPEAAGALRLWPNPTSAGARLRLGEGGGPVRVEVVDALGRVVAVAHDGPAHGDVAIPPLPAGLYTVRVSGALAASVRLVVAR